MLIKAETLNALSDMPREDAQASARKIVRHFNGIEFGIEYLSLPTGTEVAYVNTGDTYDATLLHVDGEWVVSSWGDVYEAAEAERTEETGEVRCGYCGEWSEPGEGHTDA